MLHLFCLFVCVYIYMDACVWMLKGNLQGPVFVCHPEVPRIELLSFLKAIAFTS